MVKGREVASLVLKSSNLVIENYTHSCCHIWVPSFSLDMMLVMMMMMITMIAVIIIMSLISVMSLLCLSYRHWQSYDAGDDDDECQLVMRRKTQ